MRRLSFFNEHLWVLLCCCGYSEIFCPDEDYILYVEPALFKNVLNHYLIFAVPLKLGMQGMQSHPLALAKVFLGKID